VFEVAVRREHGCQVLAPRGELDMSTRLSLEQALVPLLDTDFDQVIVDLRRVEFMDASAAALLVSCADRARGLGIRLSLILGRPQSHRVLALCGLLERFDILDAPSAG
jgi:anti-sigma B factor antagonist